MLLLGFFLAVDDLFGAAAGAEEDYEGGDEDDVGDDGGDDGGLHLVLPDEAAGGAGGKDASEGYPADYALCLGIGHEGLGIKGLRD